MRAGLDFCMDFMDEKGNAPEITNEARLVTPVHPGCAALRRAVYRNIVSFPSQTPVFLKQPAADVQWRIVLLYFVRGWRAASIATRFNVPKHRIWKILNQWSVRALALGYIQVIDEEAFAICCRLDVEEGRDRDTGETLPATNNETEGGFASAFPETASAKGRPVDSLEKSIDLIAALDIAIAHCEDWRDIFWVRASTLLRDMRKAAAVALELRRSKGPADRLLAALQSAESHGQNRPGGRGEKQGSHAVV
jgi:hypothetical protein